MLVNECNKTHKWTQELKSLMIPLGVASENVQHLFMIKTLISSKDNRSLNSVLFNLYVIQELLGFLLILISVSFYYDMTKH